MKKVTSYNLKKTNAAGIADKSLLTGHSSASLYMDKLMDVYLSDTGFLVDLSDESAALLKGLIDKHERTAGWLLSKMIIKFCRDEQPTKEQTTVEVKPKAPKAKRKATSYPNNIDDQFTLLWDTKGKKGAKQKAYDKYRSLMANNSDEICEQATMIMINDINANKGECGYPEMHLITYLNQARWEK